MGRFVKVEVESRETDHEESEEDREWESLDSSHDGEKFAGRKQTKVAGWLRRSGKGEWSSLQDL